MALNPGSRLGPYEILAPIGKGGMGEVYRARDTKLKREVAIKILPAEVAADTERLRRFEKEAWAASALNHPNIVTIHDVGREQGVSYIALELVEGKTLRDLLAGGPLPSKRLLSIAAQAAEGLARAHEAGIVHRDLKPENLMVTRDGFVKILDFGLAKLVGPPEEFDEATHAPTVSVGTEQGVVIGTVAYMSPEQASGTTLDFRSDQFSLGAVLYEMAVGRQPFHGDTRPEILTAIIREEPEPLASAASKTPPPLRWIIERCLAKEPEQRYASTKDLARDLRTAHDRLAESKTLSEAPPRGRLSVRNRSPFVLAGIAAAVLLISVSWWATRRSTIDSVAVLPFENASGNPDTQYLSDGITEALINDLSEVPGLTVISRSTTFRFRGKDPATAGRQLGVRAVLTGRVVERGNSLSVSVELIEIQKNRQIWGERYERNRTDLLELQEHISQDISRKLRLRLSDEAAKQRARKPSNAEAYDLYLRGRYFSKKYNRDGLMKAIGYFQQAIEKDPAFALAYSGLSDSYSVIARLGIESPNSAYPQAVAAAKHALDLDPSLAEAHTSLALLKQYYELDWRGAENEFRRAIELNPSEPEEHHWFSHFWLSMGDLDRSLLESKRALELDPLSPSIVAHLADHYIFARQFDQAIVQARKALELDPNYWNAHRFLGWAHEQKAEYKEAIAELETVAKLNQNSAESLGSLGHAYATSGDAASARRLLDQLKERARQSYVSPYSIALIYIGLDQKDEAFAWLERALNEHIGISENLKLSPRLDPVRADPRFLDLLRRSGLP